MTAKQSDNSAIVLYKSKGGDVAVDVKLKEETVWLSLNQMAELFQVDKSGISRHIKNIYDTGELKKRGTVAKIATVQKEGSRSINRQIEHYNLDMILSVGYRVNSKEGTQFRIWATNVLKDHLLKGYTINQKRLQQKQYDELKDAFTLIQSTMQKKELESDEAKGLLEVITDYTQSWLLFAEYDEGEVSEPKMHKGKYTLTYDDSLEAIAELRSKLEKQNQASSLFGQERDTMLEGIIGNLHQTFDKQELYPTVEEKAAHLLYFVIKDHPFSDGNKRIGSLLFLLYLKRNAAFRKKNGERKFNDAALVALALLIAESDPRQKDTILKLIMQFVS